MDQDIVFNSVAIVKFRNDIGRAASEVTVKAKGPWITSMYKPYNTSAFHTVIVDKVQGGIVYLKDAGVPSNPLELNGVKFGAEAQIKIDDFVCYWSHCFGTINYTLK
jgi:hypothetical protein